MKAEKTRAFIAGSLHQLLKRHSFDSITVSMICEESGVSRTTFYRFFKDKYDVLVLFFIQNYEEIGKRYPDSKDYILLMTGFLNLLKEYQHYSRQSLLIEGPNSLGEYLFKTGIDYYVACMEKALGKKLTHDQLISIDAFMFGVLALTRRWVKENFPENAEALARIFHYSMPNWMHDYFA